MIFFKDGFVTFFTNLGEKVKITKTKLEESWHTFKGYLSPPPNKKPHKNMSRKFIMFMIIKVMFYTPKKRDI